MARVAPRIAPPRRCAPTTPGFSSILPTDWPACSTPMMASFGDPRVRATRSDYVATLTKSLTTNLASFCHR